MTDRIQRGKPSPRSSRIVMADQIRHLLTSSATLSSGGSVAAPATPQAILHFFKLFDLSKDFETAKAKLKNISKKKRPSTKTRLHNYLKSLFAAKKAFRSLNRLSSQAS